MKRRNIIKIIAGAALAPVALLKGSGGLRGMPNLITVDTPGSEKIEVFNKETGQIHRLVQAVNQKEGWIDQIRTTTVTERVRSWNGKDIFKIAGRECIVVDKNDQVVVDRIHGPWGVRWRTEKRDQPRQVYGTSQA